MKLIAFIALATSLVTSLPAAEKKESYWPKEFVEAFATLPVQDGGRIKPMESFARFKLIPLHGRAKHILEEPESFWSRMRGDRGVKISATEWMLDVLVRPDIANDYPTFQVNNSAVLDQIGVKPHTNDDTGKVVRRDRYSYNELQPGRDRLAALREKYLKIDSKARTVVEQQIVDLGTNVSNYEGLTLLFKFAHMGLQLDPNDLNAEEVGADKKVSLSFLLENLDKIEVQTTPLQSAITTVDYYMRAGSIVALFPPVDPKSQEQWKTPGHVIQLAYRLNEASEEDRALALKRLKLMENFIAKATVPEERMTALEGLRAEIIPGAKVHNAYNDIQSEVKFYKWKNLLLGPWLFVLACIMVALSWLKPGSSFSNRVRKITFGWLMVPTLLLIFGITWRCLLKNRPPVTTLYETILFITAVGGILLIIIEAIRRNGLALAITPFICAGGLFLAMRYELVDGQDTMTPLVAVLDTNFWLSTHVTTVTMGYAAGLFAAAFSAVYIFARLTDPMKKRISRGFYKDITGMTYGIVCFGLLFSLVGTILGGIWANDSWGRFWGWDPKENGALMIVIMNLIILHGRVGGYLRELGIHLATVFGAIVVCYSWWGVNLLGAGLHSYGFTSGVKTALNSAYASLYTLIVIGCCVGLYERFVKRAMQQNAPAGVPAKVGS